MIEILSEMQARIHTMRDGVLKEGSVMPEEDYIIASLDAKKKILWYQDLLAALTSLIPLRIGIRRWQVSDGCDIDK
jgi:hypothetical protein